MIVFLDDNMPPYLAHAFQILQAPQNLKKGRLNIEVKHIRDVFGKGAKDLDWITALAKNQSYVITQDIHITRRKDEIAAYQANGICMFFIKGRNSKDTLSAFDMVEILAKQWESMVAIMIKQKGAFAYRMQLAGKPKKI